jgi:hypothetical protein
MVVNPYNRYHSFINHLHPHEMSIYEPAIEPECPRPDYVFPQGVFSGDSTRWGATDFYDQVKTALVAAMRSGLDFETPWMSCNKECISTQVSRTKGKTTVRVSVSDDFDTPGMGEASAHVMHHSKVSDERIVCRLQELGDAAHQDAEDDRKGNADYVGYSVGPDEKPYTWVLTYLVNAGGEDTPSGDYYFWWGWQDVEDDEEPRPPEDQIPAEVADKLAEMMEEGISPAVYGGFRATRWNP